MTISVDEIEINVKHRKIELILTRVML